MTSISRAFPLGFALAVSSAVAQTSTWTGLGPDSNWSTAANWQGNIAPLPGAALLFTGTGTGAFLTPVNDVADASVGSIDFGSGTGNFALSGQRIFLSGNLQSVRAGTTTVSNDITLTGPSHWWVGSGGTLVMSGHLSSPTYGLTKRNAGTLSLAGTATLAGIDLTNGGSGTLDIAATAAVSVTNAVSLRDGALTLNGGTLTATDGLLGVDANGTSSVVVNGGTWTNSNRLYVGFRDNVGGSYASLTINGGTVSSNAGRIGAGGFSGDAFVNGGTWNTNTLEVGVPNAFSAAGSLQINGSGTVNLDSGAGTLTIRKGQLWIGSGGVGGTLNAAVVNGTNNGGLVRFNHTNNLAFPAAITGNLSVQKEGSGTVTLTGANTYTGATTISGGLINFSSAANLGTEPVTLAGGGLQWAPGNTTDISPKLSALGAGGGTFDTNGNDVTFATPLSGTALTKAGAGTLTLAVANTYTGATTVTGGTLLLGASGSLGPTSALTIASGATLDAAGYSLTIPALAGSGTLTGSGALTFNSGANTSVPTLIAGAASFTKAGAGTLTLTGNNSFSGGTTLAGGTLALGHANALGATGSIAFTGGTLQYSAAHHADNSARFSTAAGQQYSIDTNNQNVTLAANLASSGASFTKSGAGTVTLTGSNTFAGGTNLNGGTLALGSAGAIGSTGTISFAGGGTLQYSAANPTDFNGRINTGPNQFYSFDTNGQNVTYTGNLTSSGGNLTKLGTGTLTVNGAVGSGSGFNLYIGGGTLQVGNGGAAGSYNGTMTINGGATFAVNSSGSPSLDYAIAGTGSLVKSGSGTLTVNGTNTFSGGTTINGGTLVMGNANALGTASLIRPVTINAGGTLNAGGAFIDLQRISGAGAVTGSGGYGLSFGSYTIAASLAGTSSLSVSTFSSLYPTAVLTLTGNNSYTGGTYLGFASEGFLILGSAGAIGTTGAITFSGGTLVYSAANTTDYSSRFASASNGAYRIDTAGQNVTFASAISAPSLVKLGAGTLTLTGANTLAGTTVSGGLIRFGNLGNFGSGGVALNGGGLQWATGNTADISAKLGAIGAGGAIFDSNGNNVTFATALSGSGGFTKTGAGLLTLTKQNTHTGGTTVNGGVLVLNGPSTTIGLIGAGDATIVSGNINLETDNAPFGTAPSSSVTLRINTGGLLSTVNNTTRLPATILDGGRIDTAGGGNFTSGNYIFTNGLSTAGTNKSTSITGGAIALPTAVTIGTGDTLQIASVILGANLLVKQGPGTLTLTAQNTFTGGTTVSAGTLALNGPNDGTGVILGALTIDGGTAVADLQSGNAFGYLSGSKINTVTIRNGGTLRNSANADNGWSVAYTLDGGHMISNGGVASTTSGSKFAFGGGSGFPTSVTVTGSAESTISGHVDLRGDNGNMTTDITVNPGATLRVSAGISTNAMGGTGLAGLTKKGGGTMILTAANIYNGGTTLAASGGTLLVNNPTGSGLGTGAVSTASGSTLGGSGSFTGALTLGGAISPGSAGGTTVGTLATGPQTWSLGSRYVWNLADATGAAGTGYDLLSINGGLTNNATSASRFTISVTSLAGTTPGNAANFNPTLDQSWVIATATSVWAFNANQFTIDLTGFTNAVGPRAWWNVTQVGNNLQLNFMAIPEPTPTAVAITFLLATLVLRRRKVRS